MIAALISGGSFWNCATSASRTDLSLSSVIAPAAFASTSPLRVDAHAAMRTSASRSRISGTIASMSAPISPPICASAWSAAALNSGLPEVASASSNALRCASAALPAWPRHFAAATRTSLRESSSSGRIASAFSADACAAKTTARTAARMFGSGSLAYLSTAATCGFACAPSRAKN